MVTKKTEIGVLPSDWSVVTLLDCLCGKPSYGINAPAIAYSPQKPRYIRITDITEAGTYSKRSPASVEDVNIDRYYLKENDIVLARTGASVGKSYLYQKDDGNLIYAGFLIKASINDIVADARYVFACLHTQRYWQWVNTVSVRSGQPGINGEEYSAYLLPLPSRTEQTAIADAISDTDRLISSLQKLIEKKKAIKQGAMQELLTGKKRLPGFSVEWSQAPFGDLFDFLPTNAFTRDQMTDTGTIQNVHYGDILTKYGACLDMANTDVPYLLETVSVRKYSESSYVREGDVIIADTAEDSTVGKCVELVNVHGKVLSGQHTMLCRPKVTFAPKFLGYYMNAGCFHNQMLPFITGIKVSSISKANISTLVLKYPTLVEEQQAIAQVFSDMDEEIAQLEKELAKYQQIKQGMMQELLTGRIRLV